MVNHAQDLMSVKKFLDLPNKLIPSLHVIMCLPVCAGNDTGGKPGWGNGTRPTAPLPRGLTLFVTLSPPPACSKHSHDIQHTHTQEILWKF